MSVSASQSNGLYGVFDRVYEFCSRVSSILGGIAMVSMMLLITLDVASRKLGIPSYIGDEVSGYLLVGLVFLGLVHTQRKGKHIQITAVTDTFFPRANQALDTANLVISAVLVGWMAWQSAIVTIEHYIGSVTSLSVLQFPLWIVWLQIPVGLSMFFIGLIGNLISRFVGRGVGDETKAPDYQSSWREGI